MGTSTTKEDTTLWHGIHDHALKLAPNDIITYQQLTNILGYDPSTPGQSRTPIYVASKHLLEDHNRTLVAVRGKGYRVAPASEHERLARGQQHAARRRIGKAVALATHVDFHALTPKQQKAVDAIAHVLKGQQAMLDRHDEQIGRVETSVRRVDDRIAALEAVLAQHGIAVPQADEITGEVLDDRPI